MKIRVLLTISIIFSIFLYSCSSTQTTPKGILNAFVQALEKGNLEEALSFLSDDFYFIEDPGLHFENKEELAKYLETFIVFNSDIKLSNIKVDGDNIYANFEYKVFGNNLKRFSLQAKVENNLITVFHYWYLKQEILKLNYRMRWNEVV